MALSAASKALGFRAARYMTSELAFSQGYVRTPGGFRHKSYVHVLKEGESVIKQLDGVGTIAPKTNQFVDAAVSDVAVQDMTGTGGGWVTWASWGNTGANPITSLTTTWTVPANPINNNGQLIYLFNALEDRTGATILQPVLQWGISAAGGGNSWGVASWYVDSSHHAYCTPVVPVNEGELLVGTIKMTDAGIYRSEFQGVAGTAIIAQGLPAMPWATLTLEAYGLKSGGDYPAIPYTGMSEIGLEVGGAAIAVEWTASTMANPPFGEHTDIASNANPGGKVVLFY
jgi:hypothetical protein